MTKQAYFLSDIFIITFCFHLNLTAKLAQP